MENAIRKFTFYNGFLELILSVISLLNLKYQIAANVKNFLIAMGNNFFSER